MLSLFVTLNEENNMFHAVVLLPVLTSLLVKFTGTENGIFCFHWPLYFSHHFSFLAALESKLLLLPLLMII